MDNPIITACLVAVFSWWFFTGAILLAVRLCDRNSIGFRAKVTAVSPFFCLGLWIMVHVITSDVQSVYLLSSLHWQFGVGLNLLFDGHHYWTNTTDCPRVLMPLNGLFAPGVRLRIMKSYS